MSIPDPDQSSLLTKILTTILILPKLIILAVFWLFTVGGGCLVQIGAMVSRRYGCMGHHFMGIWVLIEQRGISMQYLVRISE